MSPRLCLIAAVGRNGAIGAGNRLPWRLPSDLRHFRTLTLGRPVLMGRRTFDSIGKPLPGRAVVVVSADPTFAPPPGVEMGRTLEEALERAAARAKALGVEDIMVAGGATVYRALMPRAWRMHLTEVDIAPDADTFFPEIEALHWRVVRRESLERAPGDDAAFTFVDYERAPGAWVGDRP